MTDRASITRLIHRTVIGLLKRRLPLIAARWGFRAYNKVLPWAVRECVATTYFGARMRCDPADFIQRTVLHFDVWEPDVSRTIERNLAAGDVFVDIGANVGYDTLLASSCVGSSGRVVAIEASPSTFALLQRNVSLNPFTSNVRAVNAAVSDRRGTTRLFEVEAANIGTATTLASRGRALLTEVDAFTLEDILSPDEMRRARLIKIDVEGAEQPILHHILSRLSSYPPTLDLVVEANPSSRHGRLRTTTLSTRICAGEASRPCGAWTPCPTTSRICCSLGGSWCPRSASGLCCVPAPAC